MAWALAATTALTAIGCVEELDFESTVEAETQADDESSTTDAPEDLGETTEDGDGGDGDSDEGNSSEGEGEGDSDSEGEDDSGDGDGDSGEGDGDSGDGDGDGDSGEGDGDTGDAGFCGDGIVDPGETCDSAGAIMLCAEPPGLGVCRADCTFDDSFCDCTPGSEGCLCDTASTCDKGLACVDVGVPLCVECLDRKEPCSATTFCCPGLSCVENDGGDWTCQ